MLWGGWHGHRSERTAVSQAVWEAAVQKPKNQTKRKQVNKKKHCFGFSQEPRTVNRGAWKANIFYPGEIGFA